MSPDGQLDNVEKKDRLQLTRILPEVLDEATADALIKQLNVTIDGLENEVKKDKDNIEAKLSLQKLQLLRRRLINVGKKLLSGKALSDEERKMANEEQETVLTEIRGIVYALNIEYENENIHSFDSLDFKSKIPNLIGALDRLLSLELKSDESLSEVDKKNLETFFDRARRSVIDAEENQTLLEEAFVGCSSPMARAYCDMANKALARNLWYVGNVVKNIFASEATVGDIFAGPIDFSAEGHDPKTLLGALELLDKRSSEVVTIASAAEDMEKIYVSENSLKEFVDTIFDSPDKATDRSKVNESLASLRESFDNIRALGLLNGNLGTAFKENFPVNMPLDSLHELDIDALYKTFENWEQFSALLDGDDFKKLLNLLQQLKTQQSEESLVEIYKSIGTLGSLTSSPIFVEKLDGVGNTIRYELVGRRSLQLLPEYQKLQKNWSKFFDLKIEKNENGEVINCELIEKKAFIDLHTRIAEGKASDSEVLDYSIVQAQLQSVNFEKAALIDEVNELVCDEWMKDFYEASRELKNGNFIGAKKLLIKWRKTFEEKYGKHPENMVYRRACEMLRQVALFQLDSVKQELDRTMDSINNWDTTAAGWYTHPSYHNMMKAMVRSQYLVLNLAEQAIKNSDNFSDASDVLNALRNLGDPKDAKATFEAFKKFLTGNGVKIKDSDVYHVFGDVNMGKGFFYWRTRFGTDANMNMESVPEELRKLYTEPKYFHSIDIVRLSESGMKDNFLNDVIAGNEGPMSLNWELIEGLESEGAFGRSESYYKRHFAVSGLYEKYAEKAGLSLDAFVADFDNDPERKEDLDKEVKEYINACYKNHELGKMFGKEYDKPYNKWLENSDLKEKLTEVKEMIKESKYERFLEKKVLEDASSLYEYFDEHYDKIFTSTSEAYKKFISDGMVPDPKTGAMRPLTQEDALLVQFGIYNEDYKEYNRGINIFRVTLSEQNRLLKELPLDIAEVIMSAGLSMAVGRGVSMVIARKFMTEVAEQLTRGTVKKLLLQGTRRSLLQAMKMLIKQAPARLPGFFVESFVFTALNIASQYIRSGGNMRLLTDWEGNLKSWGKNTVTLGVLRATSLPLMGMTKNLTGFTKTIATGAIAIPIDTAALTFSGMAYEAALGGYISEDYVADSIRENVIMCIGVRAGHGILDAVHNPMSPTGRIRRMQRGLDRAYLSAKEGERPLTRAEMQKLADYNLSGAEAGDINSNPVHEGLTPEQVRNLLKISDKAGVDAGFWRKFDSRTKGEILQKVSENSGKSLSRQEIMDMFKEGKEGIAVLRILIPTMEKIDLKAEDVENITKVDPMLAEVIVTELSLRDPSVLAKLGEKLNNLILKELGGLENLRRMLREEGVEVVRKKILNIAKRLKWSASALAMLLLSSCGTVTEKVTGEAVDSTVGILKGLFVLLLIADAGLGVFAYTKIKDTNKKLTELDALKLDSIIGPTIGPGAIPTGPHRTTSDRIMNSVRLIDRLIDEVARRTVELKVADEKLGTLGAKHGEISGKLTEIGEILADISKAETDATANRTRVNTETAAAISKAEAAARDARAKANRLETDSNDKAALVPPLKTAAKTATDAKNKAKDKVTKASGDVKVKTAEASQAEAEFRVVDVADPVALKAAKDKVGATAKAKSAAELEKASAESEFGKAESEAENKTAAYKEAEAEAKSSKEAADKAEEKAREAEAKVDTVKTDANTKIKTVETDADAKVDKLNTDLVKKFGELQRAIAEFRGILTSLSTAGWSPQSKKWLAIAIAGAALCLGLGISILADIGLKNTIQQYSDQNDAERKKKADEDEKKRLEEKARQEREQQERREDQAREAAGASGVLVSDEELDEEADKLITPLPPENGSGGKAPDTGKQKQESQPQVNQPSEPQRIPGTPVGSKRGRGKK